MPLPALPFIFNSSDQKSEIRLVYIEYVSQQNDYAGNIAISYHTRSGLGVERLGYELYEYGPKHCGMFANIQEDDVGHDYLKFHSNNRNSLSLRSGQGDSFDWEHCHQVHRRDNIIQDVRDISKALSDKRINSSLSQFLLAASDASKLLSEFDEYVKKYPIITGKI
ncbi:hypothetical protein [Chromobacterium piscinae]|uniref:hypothetical protein n=1 Tax=Chromobacterium piscinae TaxID=686831 RepID=UPI003209F141